MPRMDTLIKLDEIDGDGSAFVSEEFTCMDSLQQADLLQDWRLKLDEMYEKVLINDFLQDLAPKRFKRLN